MDSKKVEIVGQYAATLSLVEVALGSLLHALHIPLSGTFLSLNQGFLLCRATLASRELAEPKLVPYAVSNVAAVLKSLAPAGKKLGPMLSLSMQGFLFSLGVWIFGGNLLGLCLGMFLLSVWTFLQPLLTYYLFFGSQLFEAIVYMLKALEKGLPALGLGPEKFVWIFVGLVVFKAMIAVGLAILAWKSKGAPGYQDRLMELALARGLKPLEGKPGAKRGSAFFLAFTDLFRPFFLVSILITGLFLYFSNREGMSIAWMLMRPLAIGFLFFYFSRTLTLDRWLARLEGGRLEGFGRACGLALEKLRKIAG